jgi:N-sulfoglucosamine sulfohydrolase
MMEHRTEPGVERLFERAFGKRPGEELYDLHKDPDQLDNVADKPEYAEAKEKLSTELTAELKATKDPRILGKGDMFDKFPYYGSGNKPKAAPKPGGTTR